ncbi:Transcription factor [Mucor circinelloides]
MTGIDHNEKKDAVNAASQPVDESQVKNQTKQSNAPGVDEAPMAVLPLNSSTKLDQEPNPFEQSFSGVAAEDKVKDKLKLPPVASITSPSPVLNSSANNNNNTSNVIGGGILPKEVSNQFTWDTLRTGPLSPSMLQGPANPDDYYASSVPKGNGQLAPPMGYSARSSFSTTSSDVQYAVKVEHQQSMYSHPPPPVSQPSKRTRQQSASSASRKRSVSQQADDDSFSMDSNESNQQSKTRRRSSAVTNESEEDNGSATNGSNGKKKTKSSSKDTEDDEKRKNFLERNRIAALKCRQRKKQWLNNLQAKVEFLTSDNERLQIQSESLKEEIVNLKTLLLAHKECPVAQSNGFHPNSIQKSMPSMMSTQMMRQGIPSTMGMMAQQQPSYLNRNSTTTSTSSLPVSGSGNSSATTVATSSSSSSSIPQYQRTNMMTVQPQQSNQQGMVAGGSSGVLRF